jgi:hypothetical protein
MPLISEVIQLIVFKQALTKEDGKGAIMLMVR